MTDKPLLAVTIGDPSGIGPEVVVKAFQHRHLYDLMRPVLVGTVLDVQKGVDAINSSDTVVAVDSPADANGLPGPI